MAGETVFWCPKCHQLVELIHGCKTPDQQSRFATDEEARKAGEKVLSERRELLERLAKR